MSPDDPRHGTTAGYAFGCRCPDCSWAIVRYEKGRRLAQLRGVPYRFPAIGTQRRIRALMRLGWTAQHIADACGWKSGESVNNIARRKFVYRDSAERVADAYEAMSMRLGPSVQTRKRAERNGWPPPLAWDDIDNDAAPKGKPRTRSNRPVDEIDHAVVSRVMEGERMRTTPAEKREVVRRWLRDGRPLAELERRQGWKADRYTERGSDYEETA